jgi:hypothetical protein
VTGTTRVSPVLHQPPAPHATPCWNPPTHAQAAQARAVAVASIERVNQLLASHSSAGTSEPLLPLPPTASGDPYGRAAMQFSLKSVQPKVMAYMTIDDASALQFTVNPEVDVSRSFQGFPAALADAEDAPTATLPIESGNIAGDGSTTASPPMLRMRTLPNEARPDPLQDSVSVNLPSEAESLEESEGTCKSSSLNLFDASAGKGGYLHLAHSSTDVGQACQSNAGAYPHRQPGNSSGRAEQNTELPGSRGTGECLSLTRDASESGSHSIMSAPSNEETGGAGTSTQGGRTERHACCKELAIAETAEKIASKKAGMSAMGSDCMFSSACCDILVKRASNKAEADCDKGQGRCCTSSQGQHELGAVKERMDTDAVLAFRPEGNAGTSQPSGPLTPLGLTLKVDISSNSEVARTSPGVFLCSLQ